MARALVNVVNGGIGEVRYSRLDEPTFQSINGVGWVLYDGRSITGSKLAVLLGITTLEDHRGLVPRAKNGARSTATGNVDGDLSLGTVQTDAMQGHIHQAAPQSANAASLVDSSGSYMALAATGFTQSSRNTGAPVTDGSNGTPRAAAETRARNITLNAFIKVN